MNRNPKRILCIIFQCTFVVLLIAAALYSIPFPTSVNTSFRGAVVTADGEIVETVDINIDGPKHNYLFKEDLFALRISTSSDDWQFATPSSMLSSRDPYIDIPYMSIPTGIQSTTGHSGGYFALSLEHGYFIAGRNDDHAEFLIGSTNSDTDPTTVLEYFSNWIDFYFPTK